MRMISSRSLFFMDCRVSFEGGILVGQREKKTFVQHCVGYPTDPILIHLVVYILEVMKCGDGVAVGGIGNSWNLSYSRWVAISFSGSCHFSRVSKTSRGDLHLFRIALSASL